ncbi:MAG: 3-isopropylmalate dehydratase large subunit [Chloroflexi bacterium]|nr:3-isopropylmalate dehydratase large subunit [Chloroflexota bacterium]|tara:strand:+ start:25270 stop:26670 length:1401 start_codon:yes stop_codon:yes gene_type:complete
MSPKTMFQKIWDSHLVYEEPGQPSILYIDLHLIHEVTTPQAFEGLRISNRSVRRPDLTVATIDHNVPTTNRSLPIIDPIAKQQIETLRTNCREFDIELYDINHPRQGIVHVIAPELGFTQPGMTIVCGDSHTSTHGAFGAFALGIGTSEVEHVLATQTLRQYKPKTMKINVSGNLNFGITAKDLILSIINQIGVNGGTGYAIEYSGNAISELSMENRMTICNMSIEAGARAGMIAPDIVTFEYLRNKPQSPKENVFDLKIKEWENLKTDQGAHFDKEVNIDASTIEPMVTWGTNPGMVMSINEKIPSPDSFATINEQKAASKALEYMGLNAGDPLINLPINRVFIGSCTNSRIEDLRSAAKIAINNHVNDNVQAMVVPGSTEVKKQAESEGLDVIFKNAGFDWREAGCSMCLGMNPDILKPKQRCASTSNRNFEGRQGKDGRTHLLSPEMAAASAIAGCLVDVRNW